MSRMHVLFMVQVFWKYRYIFSFYVLPLFRECLQVSLFYSLTEKEGRSEIGHLEKSKSMSIIAFTQSSFITIDHTTHYMV